MTTDPHAWLIALEGVPSGFTAARDAIDVVLRDRGLRRTSPELTGESLLRGAHASAVLEGSATSLMQLRDGAGDEIAADAARVSTELLSLVPVVRRQPLQALARLHTLAARGALPDELLGRPRDGEAAAKLRGIAELVVAPTQAPALAVAAVVHAELVAAAPFGSHNGIVARAAERLLFAARAVDEKSLVVPEAAHLALRPEYESNLRGWSTGGRAGRHAWLIYATEAYAAAAEASPLVRDVAGG